MNAEVVLARGDDGREAGRQHAAARQGVVKLRLVFVLVHAGTRRLHHREDTGLRHRHRLTHGRNLTWLFERTLAAQLRQQTAHLHAGIALRGAFREAVRLAGHLVRGMQEQIEPERFHLSVDGRPAEIFLKALHIADILNTGLASGLLRRGTAARPALLHRVVRQDIKALRHAVPVFAQEQYKAGKIDAGQVEKIPAAEKRIISVRRLARRIPGKENRGGMIRQKIQQCLPVFLIKRCFHGHCPPSQLSLLARAAGQDIAPHPARAIIIFHLHENIIETYL